MSFIQNYFLIGIQTGEDARFYALSSEFSDGSFSNEDNTLVIQFQVKHEQNIDCGGGYVKLWPSTLTQKDMHGDSPYNIMFGPDICGPSTKKVDLSYSLVHDMYYSIKEWHKCLKTFVICI